MNQTQTPEEIVDQFVAMFGEYEELDPELAAYADEDSVIGTSIRHPLVYSMMHIPQLNARTNQRLRDKQEALDEAWDTGKWHTYVFLYERPWRLHGFQEVEEELTDVAYWDLLAEIWIDSENIRQNVDEWTGLLRSDRGSREAMMSDKDQALLAAMPDQIVVYQGHTGARDDGWSWTTERNVAVWFAHRFAGLERDVPVLTQGVVDKTDVLAYFTNRNESEVLVPHELVRDITSTNLPKKADNS